MKNVKFFYSYFSNQYRFPYLNFSQCKSKLMKNHPFKWIKIQSTISHFPVIKLVFINVFASNYQIVNSNFYQSELINDFSLIQCAFHQHKFQINFK